MDEEVFNLKDIQDEILNMKAIGDVPDDIEEEYTPLTKENIEEVLGNIDIARDSICNTLSDEGGVYNG